MGMASTQGRFLFLTARKSDITIDLQHLSLQKTSLARDMQRVTKEYREGLNAKTLKFSNNNGISYHDLTYKTLMHPNGINHNVPFLLTNANGRVMVDSKYKKYAEMISPDGNAGGDYQAHRTEILTELTGVSAKDLEDDKKTSEGVAQSQRVYNDILNNKPKEPNFGSRTAREFFMNASSLNINGKDVNLSEKCNAQNNTVDIGFGSAAKSNAKDVIDAIVKTLETSLSSSDFKTVQSNATNVLAQCNGFIDSSSKNDYMIEKDEGTDKNCKLNVLDIFGALMAGITKTEQGDSFDETKYKYVDVNSIEYQQYVKALENWNNDLLVADVSLKSEKDNNDQIFTAEKESQINFYDSLFTAIEDNGWSYEPELEDVKFLNDSLQNNRYYITTMNPNGDCCEDGYEYLTDIATSNPNIIPVQDESAENEAIAEYENAKAVINEKESRIDTRMKNLETEQSAINTMIKSLETIEKDNIEKNFSIFG